MYQLLQRLFNYLVTAGTTKTLRKAYRGYIIDNEQRNIKRGWRIIG